jgi:OOP family OmpA-OmpF porin
VQLSPDYISVLPGYAKPSKDYDTTGSGFTFSGIYGDQWSPHLAFEINIQSSTFETGKNAGTDYYQNGATGDLVYFLGNRRAGHFTPFVLAGVGAVYDNFYPNSRDGVAAVAEAGIGIVTPAIYHGVRLRFDARAMYDSHEGGHVDARFLAGLDIPLGHSGRDIAYLPSEIIALPAKIELVELVRPVAPTELNDAPPAPVVADADGDGDGVPDSADKCPHTPRGLRVDANGCVTALQKISLEGVNFHSNDANLTPSARGVLDGIAQAFADQPTLQVEIAGHTDTVGKDAANLRLSQRRAESVRRYLISRGAAPGQLDARGYGKTQLLVDPEEDDADRQKNRRVEMRVLSR